MMKTMYMYSSVLLRTSMSRRSDMFISPLVRTVTLLPRGRLMSSDATSLDATSLDAAEGSTPSFSELGLSPSLVQSLSEQGFESPFDIQAKTLPHSLNGRNVIGRAVTGSGKTLAYALPIVHVLTSSNSRRGVPRALVITPTRELCKQVMECISSLGMGLRCVALYGGDSYVRQEGELARGVDVICATPGRLNDHVRRRTLRLDEMKLLILDEGDELLKANFKDQIQNVLETIPESKQMMLFSATMPSNVKELVQQYMPDPVTINLTSSTSRIPPSIKHKVIKTSSYNQFALILDLLRIHSPQRAIIFTRTKIEASELGSYLSRYGISASSLHSDLSQRVRESVLQRFRTGVIKIIAATDVAARGIDIPEIDLIIQIEPPPSGVDFYIHRSGRTGRKGLPGTSILLLSPSFQSNVFIHELRGIVDIEECAPPDKEKVAEVTLEKAVKSIEDAKESSLMEKARPLAKKLFDTLGLEALATAIVQIAQPMSSSYAHHHSDKSSFSKDRDSFRSRGDNFSRGSRSGDNFSRNRSGDSFSRGNRSGDSFSRGNRSGDSFSRNRSGDNFSRNRSGDRSGDNFSSNRSGDNFSKNRDTSGDKDNFSLSGDGRW